MDDSKPRTVQLLIPADPRSTNGTPDTQEYRDVDPGRQFEHLATQFGYVPYIPIRIMAWGPEHARVDPGQVRTRPGDLLHLWTRLDVGIEDLSHGEVKEQHRKRVHLYGSSLDPIL